MKLTLHARALPVALALALTISACSLLPRVGPDYQRSPLPVPQNWQTQPSASLPHDGKLEAMTDWWRQMDDPLLLRLIEAAQKESASLSQARVHIESARYEAITAGVAVLPSVEGGFAAKRAAFTLGAPLTYQTTRQASLMANWEIDLFGGIARQQESTEANLAANEARWHDARVSLAAETANAYLQIRYQERRVVQAEADRQSRAETARLTETLGKAGFQAPAQVALATASAADAANTLNEMHAQHDLQIKALVALTGLGETDLRRDLASRIGQFPHPARFSIPALSASVLDQRPDVAAAERDVATASAAIGQAQALRYPRLILNGSITPLRLNTAGVLLNATTWSIGPSLSLPLFDGGRIAANVDVAKAQYAAAEASFRQKARDAVREVEQALVRLNAAVERETDVRRAVADYRTAFVATQTRYQVGFTGLLELEEARRTMLASDLNLLTWQHEQVSAWVALYRAVGGGWQPAVSNSF